MGEKRRRRTLCKNLTFRQIGKEKSSGGTEQAKTRYAAGAGTFRPVAIVLRFFFAAAAHTKEKRKAEILFYEWESTAGTWREKPWIDAPPETLTLGLVSVEELEKLAPCLDFSSSTVQECREEVRYFRSSVEVYDKYTFGTLRLGNGHTVGEDPAAFYLCRNLFLLVSIREVDPGTAALFSGALRRFPPAALSFEKAVFAFFDGLIEGDGKRLEDLEFSFSGLEESVLRGKEQEDFTGILLREKQNLLVLHNYYEQLIDVGEALGEDENELFPEGELRYFKLYTDKVRRLSEGVESLRWQLEHCSAAYQSMLDIRLNHTMKTFTVLSALFLPLTLLTGWYGMNFQYMPELHWKYGYVFVFVLAAIIAVICLKTFKKHRWL